MIKKSNGGMVLAAVILILLVLGILVPALVRSIHKESQDTVKSGKKTVALQMAEAGQDRGAWKLRESDDLWDQAAAGTPITDYNNDRTFTDVSGGEYKIQITTGTVVGTVVVISKGRATGTTDVRAIRAVYTKGITLGAISVNGAMDYRPNLGVEWGPVVTFTSITSNPPNKYPRKFSAGQITGRDTVNDSNNGAMPSGNWAAYDYAAFYDLGTPPVVDLDYYKTVAKNTIVATVLKKGTGSGDASPDTSGGFNSGYYPSSTNPNGVKIEKGTGAGNFTFTCSTCVIYIEGEVKRYPNGAFLNVEALVVTDDMDFNAGGTPYTTTIPNTASDEYQYVPDGVNYWTASGWANGAAVTVDAGFHGFLYVGGNVDNAGGGSTMVGAMYINGEITTNTTTVYYDSSVTNNVKISNATVYRQSWDEVRVSW
jgi:hypothetical protein